MKSVFNLKYQHTDLDAKLVLALERISHIFRLLLWEQTKEYNLSPIQTQILIYIFHQPDSDKNITTLAQKLNVTKATISDAVKSLTQKKLVKKQNDNQDGRYFYLTLTNNGLQLVRKIESWGERFKKHFREFPANDKAVLFEMLLRILINFEEEGVINRNRICFTCKHFKQQKKDKKNLYFCELLNLNLKINDIRVDCPEHQLTAG